MNKPPLSKYTLVMSYKAMLYVAREEGMDIEEKYENLDDDLLREYDIDITDMIDNIEVLYKILKKIKVDR